MARDVLAVRRKRLPHAIEIVYDKYNALVCGFGSTEKASDAVFSIAVYPRQVTLFFLHGARLPDPEGMLKGGGKVARHLRLEDAATLDRLEVKAMMAMALKMTDVPFDERTQYRLAIKSVSAKQRPRRPAEKP